MDVKQFEGRKRDHIRQALDPASQATGLSGLSRIRLRHEALPELNLEDIRLETPCLNRKLATPFYVSGMTAGHTDAAQINRALAEACHRRGWAMGVGSQRRELEGRETAPKLEEWKGLRDQFPSLVLFANIGISQLADAPVSALQKLVDNIDAQALVIHVNALQEALQPEGTPRFKGALEALKYVCSEIDMPVVLKETGCGFSARTLEKLGGIGLAAIDVSGLGGTHWGRIEGARAAEGSLQRKASETFADWGIPTAETVMAAREVLKGVEIWGSGGVRTGLDAAKLIALGAHRVGYARPALEAALAGAPELEKWMELQEYELRVALFCTGCQSPEKLRQEAPYEHSVVNHREQQWTASEA
jgi:isopentenyl-diphosphate delta-isomerase